MGWNYTRDNRIDEEVKKNFLEGKRAQELIVEKLREHTNVDVIENDVFGKTKKYTPDIIMDIRGIRRSVEIKWTKKDIHRVDWKENQWREAMDYNGLLLQVSGKKLCLIDPRDDHYRVEKTYCNKPCMRFKPKWIYSFENIFL